MMLNIDDPNSKDYIRKVKLAIWKSLTMRKNGLIFTIFEAFTPVFIYLIFYIMQMTMPIFQITYVNETKTYKPDPLIMPPKLHLLYSPNISDLKDFMDSATQSMRLNSLESFSNEKEMKSYIKALQDNSSSINVIGVVFNNYHKDSNQLSYRILTKTDKVGRMGAAFQGDPPYVSVWAKDYIESGFVCLQKNIDSVFIDKKSSNKLSQQNINIKLERMPTPPHEIENSIINLYVLPFIFILTFIILFLKTFSYMFHEKSSGIRQLMFAMGVEQWQYYLEWFLYSFFAYVLNVTILTILLTINITEKIPTFIENSNPFIIWLFLLSFFVCNVVVLFLIIAIFDTYRYAQIPVMLYVILPWHTQYISPENIPFGVNILLMFIPIIALIFAIHTLCGLERIGGVHFSNLFKKPSEFSNVPAFGLIIFMFILDTIIYFLMAWYISYIFPGAFGIPKRWNFFLQKSFWTSTEEIDVETEATEVGALEKKPEIEEVKGLNAGIKIRDLKKKYKLVYAVNGLDIDIYSKQITVLLGHNGAGKTTTIAIITGMLYATSGTVIIDGMNIKSNVRKVQKAIGVCLQENTEIPFLTVLNHLMYFALLRGSSMADAKLEALQFLEESNLKSKADTVPTTLSGGMRRKLSIGMAMIGNSKVVLLDEPTSGLDPQSRRDLWDFLLATRGDRTLLITTHYMEEADVLGDRIAIMHNGQLICYGTPLFLKTFYGTGYTLSVLVRSADVSAISDLVTSYVSSASVKNQRTGSVTYALPTNNTASLSNLIQALEKNQSRLGINNFGICITSLEDVFIKVGEIADARKGNIKINSNWIQSDNELIEEFSSKFFLSLKALVYKRIYYYKHNKCKTAFYILYSSFFFIIFSLFLLFAQQKLVKNVIVDLKLDMYDKAESFYSYDASMVTVAKCYKNVVRAHGGTATQTADIYTSILDVVNVDEGQYHKSLITGAQFKSGAEIIAMYGHYAIHSTPISLNLVTNSLLHWYTSDDSYSIQVAFSPLPSVISSFNGIFVFSTPILIIISLSFFISKAVLILHEENSTGFKHLQQMSGVSKFLYWISAFVFDYIAYLFIISLFLLFLLIFDYGGCIGNSTTLAYIAYFLVLFGFSSFPFFYSFLLSNLLTTSKGVSDKIIELVMQSYFFVFGMLTGIIVFILTTIYPISNKYAKIVFILLNYYPQHALVLGLLKICMKSGNIYFWNSNSNSLSMMGHPCSDLNSAKCEEFFSFYAGDTSIEQQETFLCWDILIHWVLLILYDIGVCSYCLQLFLGIITCRICQVCQEPDNDTDDDVRNERTRVIEQLNNLSGNRNYVDRDESLDIFLVRNLHKWYLRVYAVRSLYFGVKKGECFGLLGVNGAGKTTTFKILTGEIFQNVGNVYFQRLNLLLNRWNFFKKMGYTPQFDGFINDLTVHEMLYVLGTIRGIPPNKIDNHIEKWLTIFDIHIYEHIQCAHLSGGSKRKLSSALSLIGNPILILLDEPTSGIDPVARRNLWDVLAVLQKSGRSIILTSQSMDECEALCDRLGIMVAGQFKCLGNIQYLKSKFGFGCTIKIKLRDDGTNTYIDLRRNIISRIDCTLIDQHVGMLVYKVTNKDIPLSAVFILMESLKGIYNVIEDYSISSANLEEIFLSFAKE